MTKDELIELLVDAASDGLSLFENQVRELLDEYEAGQWQPIEGLLWKTIREANDRLNSKRSGCVVLLGKAELARQVLDLLPVKESEVNDD